MPVAYISFHSNRRQGVYLWLGYQGAPIIKRIWPNEQRQDNSKNLSYTVALPAGFAWPPTKNNSVYLMVLDTNVSTGKLNIEKEAGIEVLNFGAPEAANAQMLEFSLALDNDVVGCEALRGAKVYLEPQKLYTFSIP